MTQWKHWKCWTHTLHTILRTICQVNLSQRVAPWCSVSIHPYPEHPFLCNHIRVVVSAVSHPLTLSITSKGFEAEVYTSQVPFLSRNQQCQSTEGKNTLTGSESANSTQKLHNMCNSADRTTVKKFCHKIHGGYGNDDETVWGESINADKPELLWAGTKHSLSLLGGCWHLTFGHFVQCEMKHTFAKNFFVFEWPSTTLFTDTFKAQPQKLNPNTLY